MQTERLVILSGPSGVGKDTVLKWWKAADPDVEQVIAYTTRPMAESETEGVDYHFVSPETFQTMVTENRFLEHKPVVDHFYGTPREQTDEILARGKIAVLKIDVQGAEEVWTKRPYAKSIFLLPPSFEELEKRLRARKRDSEEVIQRRLERARIELACAPRYQHRIVNEDLNEVVRQLLELTRQ